MTNEEVIRNVKTAFEWWEDNARMEEDEDWNRQHEALDIAIKALEQPSVTDFADKCKECGKILNDKLQTRWIPVSKRLPKEYSPCLCTIRNHYTYNNCVEVYGHVIVYDSDEKEWLDESSKLAFDVVAWMPLPEPYKAESEDKE